MKFISYFCLYFAVFATFWVVILVFIDNASIYSWGAVIGLAIITALISNSYNGKHDKWCILIGYRDMEEIMTCENCGCSFTDIDSEDYTDVFVTGFCCDCLESQDDEWLFCWCQQNIEIAGFRKWEIWKEKILSSYRLYWL